MRSLLPTLPFLLALALTSEALAGDPWDCRQDEDGRWICVPAQPVTPPESPGASESAEPEPQLPERAVSTEDGPAD